MTVSLADLREHIENDGLSNHIETLKGENSGIYGRAAHELDLKIIEEHIKKERLQKNENTGGLLRALNSQRNLMLVLQSYFRSLQ